VTHRPLLGVSQGCTRLVLLVGPWAVKLPNVLRGWRDTLWGLLWNLLEAELADRGWPETCPMVWRLPGGLANVMVRARPMTDSEFAAFDHADFCDKPDRPIPAQRKPDSFGFLPDGRTVCLDFAP
jgi:hypothetical protein